MAEEQRDLPQKPDESPDRPDERSPEAPSGGVVKWARRRMRSKERTLRTLWVADRPAPNIWSFTFDESLENRKALHEMPDIRALDVRGEHQITRELITEKLSVLAKKQDVIEAKEEFIQALKGEIQNLEARLRTTNEELAK